MRRLLLLLTFLFISPAILYSQSIGGWKAYTSFRTVIDGVTVSNNELWVLTSGGIIIYQDEQQVGTITTINGLSRLDGTSMAYDAINDRVFIGYLNGLIDVVEVSSKNIQTLSDIQRNASYTSKNINDIVIIDNTILVGTGFGIVEYDGTTLFVTDSYIKLGSLKVGVGVNDIFVANDSLFAASDEGIAVTSLLTNYNQENWASFNESNGFINSSIKAIGYWNGQIFASSEDKNFLFDGSNWNTTSLFYSNIIVEYMTSQDGNLVALASSSIYFSAQNNNFQLLSLGDKTGTALLNGSTAQSLILGTQNTGVGIINSTKTSVKYLETEGPFLNSFQGMTIKDGILISGSTRVSSRNTLIDRARGYYIFSENKWENYNYYLTDILKNTDMRQVFSSTITDEYYYFGSWGRGVVRHKKEDGEIFIFDENNSTLRGWASDDANYPVITGLATDSNDDVWLISRFGSTPLYMQSPGDDDWKQFVPNNVVSSSDNYENLFIDSNNQKWIPLQNTSTVGTGLLILDTGNKENSADDKGIKLTNGLTSGNLPDNKVKAIIEDKNGEVWIGTERGIARFLFPDLMIEGGVNERKAQWLINEDTSAVSRYLLRDVNVTTMAVNAANEKWIGSEGQGVWVVNSEGSRIIKRFTVDNSPLFSNSIISIAINDETGEVFIATDVGLVSYLDAPKKSVLEMKDLKVYPNPFSYSKHSSIKIDGLAESTRVNIIAVDGTVVNTLETKGGRVIWDGFDYYGIRLGTGVYYVVAIGDNTSTSKGIGKIIIVN